MSVTIVPYRPDWSAEFYAVARALRIALGDSALRIDHIGSTAVPGLAAKDRIDVQACVTELSSVDAVEPRLKSVGYEARPDISHDHVPANMIENTCDWEKRFLLAGQGIARQTSICAGSAPLTSAMRSYFGTISELIRPVRLPTVS